MYLFECEGEQFLHQHPVTRERELKGDREGEREGGREGEGKERERGRERERRKERRKETEGEREREEGGRVREGWATLGYLVTFLHIGRASCGSLCQ